jgi:demethylmenaquinone methyltransferase / 2-methoxy-6-polyprenyl-1,4-benzoquinol methylase
MRDHLPPFESRPDHAVGLFEPLGSTYGRVGAALSFGQDPLWRRFLVDCIPRHGNVLDVATGTGLVAERLVRRGQRVTGVDQSRGMLAEARRRLSGRVELVEASADSLPFRDASFEHLTFTYLLRYVDSPADTLRELARVVRPGGTIASLEFHVPVGVWRPLWNLYVGYGLPAAGRVISQGWHEVGRFLGPSIVDFYDRFPLSDQLGLWHDAGIENVRARTLSLGGAVVIVGRRA